MTAPSSQYFWKKGPFNGRILQCIFTQPRRSMFTLFSFANSWSRDYRTTPIRASAWLCPAFPYHSCSLNHCQGKYMDVFHKTAEAFVSQLLIVKSQPKDLLHGLPLNVNQKNTVINLLRTTKKTILAFWSQRSRVE